MISTILVRNRFVTHTGINNMSIDIGIHITMSVDITHALIIVKVNSFMPVSG